MRCPCCLKYLTDGIVYCTCGTCLAPTEYTRKLKRNRFDALAVPNFVTKKRVHAMVLVTVNPKIRFNASAFPTKRNTQALKNVNRLGMKNFANVLTELHAETIHTLPLGTKGEDMIRIGSLGLNSQNTSRTNEVKIRLF